MKKKSNAAETLILVLLVIVLGGYAAITYLIKPLKEQNTSLESEISQQETTLMAKYASTLSYQQQAQRLEEVEQAIEGWNGVFYSNLNEEYLIDHVRKNLADNKLTLISLSAKKDAVKLYSLLKESGNASAAYVSLVPAEEGQEAAIDLDSFKKAFEAMKTDKGRMASEVTSTTITLSASGSYKNVLRFLESVKMSGKTILISSLSLDMPENSTINTKVEASKTDPNTSFSVTLVFVDIPAADSYSEQYTAEELVPYTFPGNIQDKSYRKASGGLSALLSKLF